MKNFLISIKITIAFAVILFLGYVLVLWGISSVVAPNGGKAETLTFDGKVVGASNVAQNFTSIRYFWSRPSAVNYDGSGSGGSNKSNADKEYLAEVENRIDAFLVSHPYLNRSEVPSEMVTASSSGLDPHISPNGAMVQAQRVAVARGVDVEQVLKLVEECQEKTLIGVTVVNVLKLNIALDEKYK
ncbi:MAG: potassium-transporting ATPase subunit C [Rikenellaceae bacterium]